MVKKGININLLELEDFESLGIKEEIALKILEERKLKGEFVNPEEIKHIIGEENFKEILRNYNLYAVSKIIWERRITTNKFNIYKDNMEICFLSEDSCCLKFRKNLFVLGIDFETNTLIDELGTKKFFSFISKSKIDAIFFVKEEKDKLDKIRKYFRINKIYSDGLSHGREIDFGDFKLKVLYPLKEEEKEALVMKLEIGDINILFLNTASFEIQKKILNNTFSSIIHSKIICLTPSAEIFSEFLKEAGKPYLLKYEKGMKLITDGSLVYVPGKLL